MDTCVIIDILCSRAEGYETAITLLDYCTEGKVKLYTSIQSFSNISYILKNEISSKDLIDQFADLVEIIDITYEDTNTFMKSIEYYKSGKVADFEDSIQFSIAVSNECDYIITRDNAFLKADKKVITPEEALNLIH
jgi:predicted nucleic acid-binding protein